MYLLCIFLVVSCQISVFSCQLSDWGEEGEYCLDLDLWDERERTCWCIWVRWMYLLTNHRSTFI